MGWWVPYGGTRSPATVPRGGAARRYGMDRLDSLLPTAPVVWLLLALFVGTG
ncbi:hypothetical protein [Streptomyces sp. NPDC085529]|uniref:hypothetical protein n=1 Tax=Streptomyces sp. NPDC085529 TaxID=3365729 RepID=UPI0037D22927